MTTQLEYYLNYYQTLEKPRFGVLITGDWGTGKTYQVLKCIRRENRIYVSLFGLTSAEEIRTAILSKVTLAKIPTTNEKVQTVASNLDTIFQRLDKSTSLAWLTQGIANIVLSQESMSDRVLIFDDLERSCLRPRDLFGIVNSYIEEYASRVVIICNESELPNDFGIFKEKLIGQTIQIVPQVPEAFQEFLTELKSQKSHTFLTSHKELVLRLFSDSSISSLRVLRHMIRDLDRLFACLEPHHYNNDHAMNELVGIFCARSIAIRTGQIDEEDMRNKVLHPFGYIFGSSKNEEGKEDVSKIIRSEERFPTVNFHSDLLDVEVLIEMLVEGRYNKTRIQNSLNDSIHFRRHEDLPPWKVVTNFDSLDDSTVNQAVARMRNQICTHEPVEIGEMLHCFSLMMMMSTRGIVCESISDILAMGKDYVDALLRKGKLPPEDEEDERYHRLDHAYDGYAYWLQDEYRSSFDVLVQYINDARHKALQVQMPKWSENLLRLVESNGEQFVEEVCFTNSSERNRFASIPVLHHIAAKRFVDVWLGSSYSNWQSISLALEMRYGKDFQHGRLNAEREWAREVYQHLCDEMRNATGFRALRMERRIPEVLAKLDNNEEEVGE